MTEYGAEPTEREMRALLGVSGKEFERIEENAKRGKIRSLSEKKRTTIHWAIL